MPRRGPAVPVSPLVLRTEAVRVQSTFTFLPPALPDTTHSLAAFACCPGVAVGAAMLTPDKASRAESATMADFIFSFSDRTCILQCTCTFIGIVNQEQILHVRKLSCSSDGRPRVSRRVGACSPAGRSALRGRKCLKSVG